MERTEIPRLLIVGVPRSGTTWTGRVLGHTEGTVYVNEPDGFREPFSFRVMLTRGENPQLVPGDDAPDVESLWRGAFAGGRQAGTVRDRLARLAYARTPLDARRRARSGGSVPMRLRLAAALAAPGRAETDAGHIVVKSVQSTLAVEWVWERFRPRVLVVERHPLNVLASWVELEYVRNPRELVALGEAARRWGIEPPGPGEPHLVHQAFSYGVLASALRDAVRAHGDWTVVRHEDLCVDPGARFRALAAELGLEWGARAEAFVADSDREGTPYRTLRRAEEQPDRWRERLDPEQVATIRATLERFPNAPVPEL